MPSRRARARLVAAIAPLGAVAVAACWDERPRLDQPELILTVDDSVAHPGEPITGTLTAMDQSGGIIYVAARLVCNERIIRNQSRGDVPRRDSVTYGYTLNVPSDVPANQLLVVEAATIDEQNFTVTRRDTVPVRVDSVPPGPPADTSCSTATAP